jgi:hypothetical protein
MSNHHTVIIYYYSYFIICIGYYKNNKLHRVDGPSTISKSEFKYWHLNNKKIVDEN